jgi:hypothetical protein
MAYLQKITGKYELDAAEGSVGALANVADMEVEPVQKFGLEHVDAMCEK